MWYCPKCGKENNGNFCAGCGTPFDNQVSAEVCPPDAKTFPLQGTPLQSYDVQQQNMNNPYNAVPQQKKGLGTGAIIGIVSAGVVILALIVVIVMLLASRPDRVEQVTAEKNTDSAVSDTYANDYADSSDYIFADSDSRYLDESELYGLGEWDLCVARNEIYARHGRKFKRDDLQSYFNGCSWYEGTVAPDSFSESVLNKYEKANIKLIKNYEDDGGSSSSVATTAVSAYQDYASAYLDVLKKEKGNIENYKWQKGYSTYNNSAPYTKENEPKPVVIADIYDDNIPELIFVKSIPNSYYSQSSLEIYTFKKDSIIELSRIDNWDNQVAGGAFYSLFQIKNEKTLYAFYTFGDDYWVDCYLKFDKKKVLSKNDDNSFSPYFCEQDSGNALSPTELCNYTEWPSIDVEDGYRQNTYLVNGKKVDKNKYEDAVHSLTNNISAVLMTSTETDAVFINYITANGCPAMTCSEAISYLSNSK